MEELSHVGMGFTVCPHCGKQSEPQCILLDPQLRKRLPRMNFAGWMLCKEHLSLAEQKGLVCVYAVDQMEDGFQLHSSGLLMPLRLFHELTNHNYPQVKAGQCCRMTSEVVDAINSAASQHGMIKETPVVSPETVVGHA